jgi:carbon monoxide dehydrogenase subunit G
MELGQTRRLNFPLLHVWEALNDSDVLQRCLPGCESMVETGLHAYEVQMTAAVGPVRAKFKGSLKLTDIVVMQSYTVLFEGHGGAAGFAKGSAEVALESEDEDDSTLLHYTARATVGGKLAQVGSRLVGAAAEKVAADFFGRLDDVLAERHPPPALTEAMTEAATSNPPAATEPGHSLWLRFRTWLARLFSAGGSRN